MKKQSNKPLVSIIIVNWNGLLHLKDCLSSLSKITYPNYEIIMVDNASTDHSVNYVVKKFPRTKIIRNKKNLGFSEGNNVGLILAKGEYIYLLNNDTKVSKNFLTPLVKILDENSSIGVIQSKIYIWGSNKLDGVGSYLTKFGFLFHKGYNVKDDYHKPLTIFAAKGAGFITRKKIIDEIGLFDPNYFAYFEDTDFCWRVWLRGYKILFEPKSIIYHKGGQTAKKIPGTGKLTIYISFRNRIISLISNLSFRQLLKILLLHYLCCFGLVIWFTLKGKPNYGLWLILSLIWPLAHLYYLFKKRKQIANLRKKSDKEIFSYILNNNITLITMMKYL